MVTILYNLLKESIPEKILRKISFKSYKDGYSTNAGIVLGKYFGKDTIESAGKIYKNFLKLESLEMGMIGLFREDEIVEIILGLAIFLSIKNYFFL